jgi:hypothetical protein
LSAVGSTIPAVTSPGWIRSAHGTQEAAISAPSPGSNTTSFTVAFLARDARDTVTDQRQPR